MNVKFCFVLQSLFLVGLIPFVSGVNSIFSEDVSYYVAEKNTFGGLVACLYMCQL